MGKLTCKYVLHHRPRLDGTRQVRLRLTRDGKAVFVDMQLAVRSEKDWNPAPDLTKHQPKWFNSSFRDFQQHNETLLNRLRLADKVGEEHPAWTVQQVQAAVELGEEALAPDLPAERLDLVAYFAQDVQRQSAVLAPHSIGVWQAVYNKVAAYAGPAGLPFATLTPGKVREFYAWLVADPKCGVNQARLQMNFLKTVVTRAMDDGLLEYHKHPFRKLTFPKEERTERPRLTQQQTQLFLTAPLPVTPRYPFANVPRMLTARQTWLLQYLMGGSRIGDILELRWRNVQAERVVFTERKTGKKKSVKRNPALNAVLALFHRPEATESDYILPYLNQCGCHDWPLHSAALLDAIKTAVKKVNVGLRLLCTGLDLPVLTSHSARHTLLFHALESGAEISSVQHLANHSNESMTRQYTNRISDLQRKADDTMEAVLLALQYRIVDGTTVEQQEPDVDESDYMIRDTEEE